MEFIKRLFSTDGFMPHGHCYFWNPAVLRLHIVSDALIALAYLTIPLTLIYIVRRRKDIPFDWIFACFSIFIVACGVTHALEIWSIWHPMYWLSGTFKAITAAASVATAGLLIKLIPRLLAIPSPDILRQANRALANEIADRERAQEALKQLAADLTQESRRLSEMLAEREQAAAAMERLNNQLMDVSRQAGMAEVATSVLHNVGNVLNSVNVSCSMISATVRKSRLGNVAKAAGLLREHAGDLASFFANDPAGQKLPEFLGKLGERLGDEQVTVLGELRQLGQNIEHIKDIVAMQQNYARISGVAEIINVIDLVEDSLRMNAGALTRHEVQPIRDYHEVPPITVEKHKVLQVLVNLIRNAKHACDESGRADKQITVRVDGDASGVRIAVIDNGVGIPAENLVRIFHHGFTTRKDGHGFGLHSASLAAREMGGTLTVQSDGPGAGATFTLTLPVKAHGDGREFSNS